MRDKGTITGTDKAEALFGETAIRGLITCLAAASAIGLGLWTWMLRNRDLLPSPSSKLGKALLRQFQGRAHDIWLLLMIFAVVFLTRKIYANHQKELHANKQTPQPLARRINIFIRQNPLTTILFAAYIVGMISGTTYLYKDMLGWYPELTSGHFIDNFSLRSSFISETMRRTDYRFFPLAHQDLHILSWFSIHIKTWMLFSAAELIGIILLSIEFLNRGRKYSWGRASTLFLISALFLIHPSTSTAFFHVIYPERLLCLIYMLFISAYSSHLETRSRSSFYATLLFALVGIFIKDIAILLFVVPPGAIWIYDILKIKPLSERGQLNFNPFSSAYRIEQLLLILPLFFITSYIYLALIPSSFSFEDAYNSGIKKMAYIDIRFYMLAIIAAARFILILIKKIRFSLIDGMNISAFAYALALYATFRLDASIHVALPIQLIAALNIGWAWIEIAEKQNKVRHKILMSFILSSAIIATEHHANWRTFAHNVSETKFEQSYIQSSYEKLDEIARELRETGNDVNIITPSQSQFSAKRHLRRIPYKSLIEYFPDEGKYYVKDGANKNTLYQPKVGDLIANLDKSIDLIVPIMNSYQTELIYRHNASKRTGMILRIKGITNQ